MEPENQQELLLPFKDVSELVSKSLKLKQAHIMKCNTVRYGLDENNIPYNVIDDHVLLFDYSELSEDQCKQVDAIISKVDKSMAPFIKKVEDDLGVIRK